MRRAPQQSKRWRDRSRRGVPPRGGDIEGCPTPRKLAFDSQEKAEAALKYMTFQGRQFAPTRAYLCECGHWHLTSVGGPK